MKITFVLKESIFDCKIKITDSCGEREYYISALNEQGVTYSSIVAEVFDKDFSLSLIPIAVDTNPILNELEEKNWKDKLVQKAAKVIFNSFDKMILRVGCNYRIEDLQDGDRLDINLQNYVLGTQFQLEALEFMPVIYAFFEVSNFNNFYKLTDAYETNRKAVIKFAKTFGFSGILGNGLIAVIFKYPIQISRIKRLTKNKKIVKALTNFNNLNDAERQRFLEKQEKFFT